MQVNKFWHEVCVSDIVWSDVYIRDWGCVDEYNCGVCSGHAPKIGKDKTAPGNSKRKGGDKTNVIYSHLETGHGGELLQQITPHNGVDYMMVDNLADSKMLHEKVHWIEAYSHRLKIERNWLAGRFTAHTYVGHTDWVTCISQHKEYMVSGSWDSLLKVWDLSTKECVATLLGHTAGINDLDINSDGDILVSASLDCTLRIWDMRTYACLSILQGHEDQVSFAKFSNYQPHIVSASLDGTVRLWHVSSGRCISILKGHSSGITAMAVKNNLVVTGSTEGAIVAWDITNEGKKLFDLVGHTDRITSIQFGREPNSLKVATSSWDCTVRLWDLSNGTCTQILMGHMFRVKCADICGDVVVSGGWDNEAKVWDAKTGMCKQTLSGHTSYTWATQILSQKKVITGSWDHSIRLWDLVFAKCLYVLEHTSEVLCMQANSHRLIAASKEIRVWDFASGIS